MVRRVMVQTVLAAVTLCGQPPSSITMLKPFVGGLNSPFIKRLSRENRSARWVISARNGAIKKLAETPRPVLVWAATPSAVTVRDHAFVRIHWRRQSVRRRPLPSTGG